MLKPLRRAALLRDAGRPGEGIWTGPSRGSYVQELIGTIERGPDTKRDHLLVEKRGADRSLTDCGKHFVDLEKEAVAMMSRE
jgi:hypothetical protein